MGGSQIEGQTPAEEAGVRAGLASAGQWGLLREAGPGLTHLKPAPPGGRLRPSGDHHIVRLTGKGAGAWSAPPWPQLPGTWAMCGSTDTTQRTLHPGHASLRVPCAGAGGDLRATSQQSMRAWIKHHLTPSKSVPSKDSMQCPCFHPGVPQGLWSWDVGQEHPAHDVAQAPAHLGLVCTPMSLPCSGQGCPDGIWWACASFHISWGGRPSAQPAAWEPEAPSCSAAFKLLV